MRTINKIAVILCVISSTYVAAQEYKAPEFKLRPSKNYKYKDVKAPDWDSEYRVEESNLDRDLASELEEGGKFRSPSSRKVKKTISKHPKRWNYTSY